MIQDRSYNHKVDIYSFGIVLWELITLPEHDSSPGSVCCCEPWSLTPQSQLTVLQHWQKLCYDANVDAHPSFILVVKLFEPAQEEIMTTVHSARF